MCFLFKHLGPSPPQDVNSAALKLAVGLNLRSGLDFNRPPPWGDILAKKWGKGEFVSTAKRDRVPPPPTVCVKAEDQPPNGGADHTASSLPEPLSVDLPAPGRRNPCMAARQPRILSPFFSIQASAWALQACSVDCVFWRMFFFSTGCRISKHAMVPKSAHREFGTNPTPLLFVTFQAAAGVIPIQPLPPPHPPPPVLPYETPPLQAR